MTTSSPAMQLALWDPADSSTRVIVVSADDDPGADDIRFPLRLKGIASGASFCYGAGVDGLYRTAGDGDVARVADTRDVEALCVLNDAVWLSVHNAGVLERFVEGAVTETVKRGLQFPRGLAGGSDRLYVAESAFGGTGFIRCLEPGGPTDLQVATGLSTPTCLAVSEDDRQIYVAEPTSGTIAVVTPETEDVSRLETRIVDPAGLVVHQNHLYAAERVSSRGRRFSSMSGNLSRRVQVVGRLIRVDLKTGRREVLMDDLPEPLGLCQSST